MKVLHVRSLRHIVLAVSVCLIGFLLAYLSAGMATLPKEEASRPVVTPSVGLELQDPSAVPELPEESEPDPSGANYYVRLTRGLSSSTEELLLTAPSQMKATVEYRGKDRTVTLTEKEDIDKILALLQKAERLPDDTKIVSLSSSHEVSLTLPYSDGFGNIYVFQGYPDGGKKTVTLIQDNANHLYQAKSAVTDQLYDLLKPVEDSLDAERLNIYAARDYDKGSLKAQVKGAKNYALLLEILNSLEKSGSSLDLDSPDYLIGLLPSNSVQESNYCYLWLDEKQVKIAFADDDLTVYRSTEVSSSQLKKWIKEFSVK